MTIRETIEKTPDPVGWILYDDSCGFCRRWIPFWESALRRQGFGIAPLQAEWVASRLEIGEERLLDDIRLLLADGRNFAGAEVYRYAMSRIWWTRPLYLISILPGFRRIFDMCYRLFAKNRHRISDACGLPGA